MALLDSTWNLFSGDIAYSNDCNQDEITFFNVEDAFFVLRGDICSLIDGLVGETKGS